MDTSSHTPATILAPVLEFLRRHAPFEQMAPAHLEFLAKRLRLGFYARGEVVTGPDDGPAGKFFIIKQGRIRGEGGGDEEGAWELVAGECFPIGALLSHRPTHLVQRAVEESYCYELDRDAFETLLQQSAVFQDFCSRRLASLLDRALQGARLQARSRTGEEGGLNTPLKALIRRRPVACGPDAPLRDALEAMQRERVGSMVVVDGEQRPLGVFTLHDLLGRVVLPGLDLARPVREVMTYGLDLLPADAFAHEAALLMAEKGHGHLCVVEEGRLAGVLSERDLFSLQRVGLGHLSRAIPAARDLDTLARLAREVPGLIDQMLAQGASVDQLTQIITRLNDHLTRRVIELCRAEFPATPDFTWLSFGSEGRHEQTLKTDQDNGMLFACPAGESPEAVRQALLPLAERINQALDRCGYPLCPGRVMASNPECCLSLEEWRGRFARWVDQGTPEHLLKATIFFDFRPLYGDPAPVEALRGWLLEQTGRNSRFRHQLAANAMANRPPLGLIRDFVVSHGGEHPHTFDLKVQGLTPFVDAARIYALATGIGETGTLERLRAGVARGVFREADVASWVEAYQFIQLLRMRNHQRQAHEGRPLANRIDPDDLSELDRRILKEAFRQARKLQAKLALDYQL